MKLPPLSAKLCAVPMILALTAGSLSPAIAQRGMDGPGWSYGPDSFARSGRYRTQKRDRSNEGRVEVTRFTANNSLVDALGKGAVAITSITTNDDIVGPRDNAVYEAAVVDRLVGLGYDTTIPASDAGQIVEMRIVRNIAEPQEAKRKPVSGEMSVGVSNHGTMMGMGINVDMTKPLSALIATRLEIRILDRSSNTVLWEGRAQMATRDGDKRWTSDTIASKLAGALFGGFPGDSGETEIVK